MDSTDKKDRLPVLKKNPFVENANIRVTHKNRKTAVGVNQTIYTDKDGVKFNAATVYTSEKVDDAKFIKVYYDGLAPFFGAQKDNETRIAFAAVCCAVQESFDTDKIFLSLEHAKELVESIGMTFPKSRTSFTRGMRKLAEANIVAKAYFGPSWWWINPAIIFNGNRLVIAKQYVREDSPKKVMQEPQPMLIEDKSPFEIPVLPASEDPCTDNESAEENNL